MDQKFTNKGMNMNKNRWTQAAVDFLDNSIDSDETRNMVVAYSPIEGMEEQGLSQLAIYFLDDLEMTQYLIETINELHRNGRSDLAEDLAVHSSYCVDSEQYGAPGVLLVWPDILMPHKLARRNSLSMIAPDAWNDGSDHPAAVAQRRAAQIINRILKHRNKSILSDETEIHDEVCELCAVKVDYCECVRCTNCEELMSIDELCNCEAPVAAIERKAQ
jgi:hypothetical protein